VCHSTTPVDESYFEAALRRAAALRREVFRLDEVTDAYRLINSDGDGLSGLTIDRYGDTLLCEVYSLGIAQRLPAWLPILHELAGTRFARVHVDHDLGSLEGIKPSLFKETNAAAPRTVKIREHGVRYEVDFAEATRRDSSATSGTTGVPLPGSRAAPGCWTCAAIPVVFRSTRRFPAAPRR
jgi:23S rRNA (cytosine1962-C5)-methyltransferase